MEWSGLKIGVKFGVDFGVKFGVEVRFFFSIFYFFIFFLVNEEFNWVEIRELTSNIIQASQGREGIL